jgi:hypothetical protein
MQPLVINTEVVRNLMDDGNSDFVNDFFDAVAHLQRREAKNGDLVGQHSRILTIALGQWDARVEAQ